MVFEMGWLWREQWVATKGKVNSQQCRSDKNGNAHEK
jgi:hypothetical protein